MNGMENPTPYNELTPEEWGNEQISSAEAEKICADIYREEEERLKNILGPTERNMKAAVVVGVFALLFAGLQSIADGSSTADWYAPTLRKLNNMAQEGGGGFFDQVSLQGTFVLNGLLAHVGMIKSSMIQDKLHSLAEKIKQTS